MNLKKGEHVFKPGDAVVFRDSLADKIWRQAKIVKASKNPRSFDIQNEQGRVLNRNSKMLLPDRTGRTMILQDTCTAPTGPALSSPLPQPPPTAEPCKKSPVPLRRSERIRNQCKSR